MRANGKLKAWNAERGFGFIAPDDGGADVFVHISAFQRGSSAPQVGQLLSFETQKGRDGKTKAVAVLRPGDKPRARPEPRRNSHRRSGFVPRLVAVALLAGIGWYAHSEYRKQHTPHILPGNSAAPSALLQGLPEKSPFKCDGRQHCSQMTSCEEARFFVKNCPETTMDGDHDGQPCEQQWC